MKTELPQYSDHTGVRRSGQTTRLIDKYIQELFTGEVIVPQDHYYRGGYATSMRLRKDNIKRILRRLEIEHNITTNSSPVMVYIDSRDLTMQLKLNNVQYEQIDFSKATKYDKKGLLTKLKEFLRG